MGEDSFELLFMKYLIPLVLIVFLLALVYMLKRIFNRPTVQEPEEEPVERLEPMKKRDFTLEELKEYDGKSNQRILVAVNGKVFDVTRGKSYYGPDGPYGVFAGMDASRALATFSVDKAVIKDEFDDLSDLNSMQLDSLREWEMQFTEKYFYIGKLLKPGEKARNYDQESETEDDEGKTNSKKND